MRMLLYYSQGRTPQHANATENSVHTHKKTPLFAGRKVHSVNHVQRRVADCQPVQDAVYLHSDDIALVELERG